MSAADPGRSVPPTIPDEIACSLESCGGIAGLREQLPAEGDLEQRSRELRACADPIRLKILAMLFRGPLCVCVIRAVLDIADSKLSYHLSVLKKVGFITGEQQGNWIIYRLTDRGRERASVIFSGS
ncbi:MAG: ArsR/SmtB family transcription factor [Methanomicrobiales archaeon]